MGEPSLLHEAKQAFDYNKVNLFDILNFCLLKSNHEKVCDHRIYEKYNLIKIIKIDYVSVNRF